MFARENLDDYLRFLVLVEDQRLSKDVVSFIHALQTFRMAMYKLPIFVRKDEPRRPCIRAHKREKSNCTVSIWIDGLWE